MAQKELAHSTFGAALVPMPLNPCIRRRSGARPTLRHNQRTRDCRLWRGRCICSVELEQESVRIADLRDQFEQALLISIPGLRINAREASRLPNTSSLIFPGLDADVLLLNLPEVMMGTGFACSSGALEPSHVLMAMGLDRSDATCTVRASLGRFTTLEQVERVYALILDAISVLKASA